MTGQADDRVGDSLIVGAGVYAREQVVAISCTGDGSHTATTHAHVRSEVDRYIGWPGQALAYVTGKREIMRLRERAQLALGPRFDLRRFHHAVLRNGAIPIGLLDDEIERWTASQT